MQKLLSGEQLIKVNGDHIATPPMTNIGASADGAEMTTSLAPPAKCALALSMVVNTPVDSTMYSAPHSFHGISFAFMQA